MMYKRHLFASISLVLVLFSCLAETERKAAEAIARLVNARDCRVVHKLSLETVNGIEQDSKKIVVLKIEGVDRYDSVGHPELVTSIAALRYFQWQDAEALREFERVEVEAAGDETSFKKAYSMDELLKVAALEPVVDHHLEVIREEGCMGLNNVLSAVQFSDSAHARFSADLQLMDSLFGVINTAKVVGFRLGNSNAAMQGIVVFAVYIGGERHSGSYLELAIDPSDEQVIAINTFDPWLRDFNR